MMSPCIEHKQKGNKDGYASTNRKVDGVMRNVLMHRAKFCDFHKMTFDDIAGLEIRHTCDNPRCINPLHLVTGTHADNMRDMKVRGRAPVGEKSGKAVMTWEKVRMLRGMYTGNYTQADLAHIFGIGKSTVSQIIRGETWKE